MGHLHLALLGPPEVFHEGQKLKFRTRKTLALLIYLIVEGGMHPREQVMALFWPESDEQHNRTMLRTTITYLRDALGDTPTPSHLTVERNALGFDFTSDFDLDLHSFESAFSMARVHRLSRQTISDRRSDLLAQLQHATKLYRGSFLDGFSLGNTPGFDDWARLHREVWHRRMSLIFDRLSQVQSDAGELLDAIESTTRWVSHDPLNEGAHRSLMQLLLQAGDRVGALQAYETCQARLAEELCVQPSPETEALAERIRMGGSRNPLPAYDGGARTRGASSLAPPRSLPEIPLIGRAHEYSTLIEMYHAAERDWAQIVIIKGEAGIGKTRLANDFLDWTAAHGADVLEGRAFESNSSLPYQPLVDVLRRRVERENAPDDLLNDTWLAELTRLLPELRERYPDLPPPTADETTARLRLFEAIARFFQSLAELAPLVLFLDDLQWADATSLDLLQYLGRRWRESKSHILLILSLRTESLSSAPVLAKWLTNLEHDLQPVSFFLRSFRLEETIQLVQVLGGGDASAIGTSQSTASNGPTQTGAVDTLGQWLFAETAGQPFYLRETLNALLERGLLTLHVQSNGNWVLDMETIVTRVASLQGFLPASVREVIRARLTHLNSAASTLLAAGAILEHSFTFEQLCQVSGLGELEGLSALDEVLRSGQLVEGGTGKREEAKAPVGPRRTMDTYAFTHDKIRDVVYTEAGDARRRIFHRRALEVLQDTAPAAALAHHAQEAGLAEPEFRWSLAAGNEAMRLFALHEAIAYYERARQVLREQADRRERPASMSSIAVQHLYNELGRAYELTNETEAAKIVYQSMLEEARECGSQSIECAALNRLATLAARHPSGWGQAEKLLRQALQATEGSVESVERTETYWNLAQLQVYRMKPAEAGAYGERALALARQLGVPELIARSLNVLTYVNMALKRWAEAEAYAQEARTVFHALGNRAMEIDCQCLIASAHINSGRPWLGIASAQAAYALSGEIENLWGQANSAIPLAQGLLDIGNYKEALAIAEKGASDARSCGMPLLIVMNLVALGAVHRAMQSLDRAFAVHGEALAMSKPLGMRPLTEIAAVELCADCALKGMWDEAYAYAQQVLSSRTYAVMYSTQLISWYLTEVLVHSGEIERAAVDAQRYGERLGNSPRYRIPYLRMQTLLAKTRGDIDTAIEHLREAANLAEEIGLPGEFWIIQSAMGELYQLQGEGEQANRAFERSVAIVRKLAEHIGDDEQRAHFLAMAQVRPVQEMANRSEQLE